MIFALRGIIIIIIITITSLNDNNIISSSIILSSISITKLALREIMGYGGKGKGKWPRDLAARRRSIYIYI